MARGPDRVAAAAEALGLAILVRELPGSTRTTEEAAAACGCAVAQIIKSLAFAAGDGGLRLRLVSGANRVDLDTVVAETGERCDAKAVRAGTGFAIGGVAPIGLATSVPV